MHKVVTRTEAAAMVRNRWQFLGIGTPEEFPYVFSSDVDNLFEELSSTGNILDVAPQGVAVVSGEHHAEGEKRTALPNAASGLCELNPVANTHMSNGAKNWDAAFDSESEVNGIDKGQTAPADSQILDRHGDDRFADNILRALEGLPQNGDAEEEEAAAAEEGALIEASGYNDPATNPRFA